MFLQDRIATTSVSNNPVMGDKDSLPGGRWFKSTVPNQESTFQPKEWTVTPRISDFPDGAS
jgi:hypothetical protein